MYKILLNHIIVKEKTIPGWEPGMVDGLVQCC